MEATEIQTSLHQKIALEIQRFDVFALLKLLEELGYQASDIYFQSNPSFSSSSSICQEIAFFDQVYPKVKLTLNMGLLSNHSSLPSFFRKKMDDGSINPVTFARYLGFFDHYLIKTILGMGMAEANGWFFRDWNETLREYLNLLALNSSSTLELLFQLAFPELIVEAVKFPRVIRLTSSSMMLGKTKLGQESFLQKNEKLTISSLKIVLTADSLVTETFQPWAFEIKRRFKEILFSILERVNIHLQIILCVKGLNDPARLSKSSRLGYCCIGNQSANLHFHLFSGHPKDFIH